MSYPQLNFIHFESPIKSIDKPIIFSFNLKLSLRITLRHIEKSNKGFDLSTVLPTSPTDTIPKLLFGLNGALRCMTTDILTIVLIKRNSQKYIYLPTNFNSGLTATPIQSTAISPI